MNPALKWIDKPLSKIFNALVQKLQSVGRHTTLLANIFTPDQQVFALIHQHCILNRKAKHTYFQTFCLG